MTRRSSKPGATALLPTEDNEKRIKPDRRVPCDECSNEESDKASDLYHMYNRLAKEFPACENNETDFRPYCAFERQDSLARAACLQECDRIRDPKGILNFLETTMNIEDYLEDITEISEMPAEDIELDDVEVEKCNILYNENKMRNYDAYDPFAHVPPEFLGENVHSPQDDCVTESQTPVQELPEIKKEPVWDNEQPSTSSTRSSKRNIRNVEPFDYVPTTTARKYRLKTPQERSNLSYKVKRQRNNDAVRRSRTKAKQLQLMKEKQLADAIYEVAQLKEEVRVLRDKLSHCRCRK